MNIVFVSNYFNHHQMPVSKKLHELCQVDGGTYFFVQTEEMEEERIQMGWGRSLLEQDYVRNYWEDKSGCQRLIDEADVVIFGGTDRESYIQERLKRGAIIFRYSERLYKTGRYKFISPRGLLKKFKDHTRHQGKPVFLLCSGAYVAGDFRLIHAYLGKKYKYGYFPECKSYELEKLLSQKGYATTKKLSILWAGRMIDWKHPELPLALAQKLKGEDYDFHLTMIGAGALFDTVKDQVQRLGLEQYVTLPGFCSPEVTREYMEKSDLFLVTSDRQEGWGAVVNEAMNSACVVIANQAIGAVPYLLNDCVNGITYRRFMDRDCMNKIMACIKTEGLRKMYAKQAYDTIQSEWNAEEAATRLYTCMKAVYRGEQMPYYEEGPLSRHT